MMSPSIEQLICWCAAHRVELSRALSGVRATAYDHSGCPITNCTHVESVEVLPKQAGDLKRAIAACDLVAEELCLLKPSIACRLNFDHP